LASAMAGARSGEHTPRIEDYLETVYHLIREKGYATTSDVSAKLKVKPPTASIMISKLAAKGYLQHERYRVMLLTDEGEKVAKSVIRRHEVIAELLAMIGVDEDIAYEDTEGIEHHVQAATIHSLAKTAEYLKANPKVLKALRRLIDSH
jgi:Mn-dependent DtxR family transcriptional regulator